MEAKVKYPIGDQDFKSIRDGNCIYIDKTQYIDKIRKSGSKYYFLARPRRFGKSLFLSTLRYFFEGERELFKGLHIDSSDWDWQPYPVLRLDFNTGMFEQPGGIEDVLEGLFSDWEKKFDVDKSGLTYGQRFRKIIETAHEKTGRQVVILVDEYDKALVRNLNKKDNFEHYRARLASIYSNFKSCADHIRLVFLTGVSRFSKLSVFSDLNNIKDITFDEEFADVCGITERELLDNFQEGISRLADRRNLNYEEACKQLKDNYDGYRFAESGSDIYNPWSLLNALDRRKIANYWNETGKPTIVAEALKNINVDLNILLDQYCNLNDLKGLDITDINPTALLYQTGYITIKHYDSDLELYHLGVPNREVKEGLFNELIPYYLKIRSYQSNWLINDIVRGFKTGDPELAMKAMQSYFAEIDYSLRIENENNFHNAFFLLTNIIGLKTKAESHTSEGRIDIEISTNEFAYIIELKYDHSAQEALDQIDEKHYARKYQMDRRKIFLIGVEFSSKTRCIESWLIKTLC
ncbi:MAG: ATP-binding protein [Muribaculaceae bacterium]|nr:ATP-binding protein [Muribaculaceae bacterium]